MTFDEITDSMNDEIAERALPLLKSWLERGDGIALYENRAIDSTHVGAKKWVSYGSSRAQLETDEPPRRLPDIGKQINWAYQLVGTCRGVNTD